MELRVIPGGRRDEAGGIYNEQVTGMITIYRNDNHLVSKKGRSI